MKQQIKIPMFKAFSVSLVIFICTFVIFSAISAYMNISNRLHAYNSMKMIRDAESTFKNKNGNYGSFSDLTRAGLIANDLAQGIVKGYRFELTVTENGYIATATLVKGNIIDIGYYSYFLDESGEIRRDVEVRPEARVVTSPIIKP